MRAESSWLPLCAAHRFFFRNKNCASYKHGWLTRFTLWIINGSFLKCLTATFLLSVLPYCQLLARLLLSLRCIKLCSLSFLVLMNIFFFICDVWLGFHPWMLFCLCPELLLCYCFCHLVFHSQWAVCGLLFHFALHLCLLLNDICPFYANKRLFLIFT